MKETKKNDKYGKLIKIATIKGITEPEILEEPSEDISEEISESEESISFPEENEQNNVANNDTDTNKVNAIVDIFLGLAIDKILVYGFVSITLIGALVAMVVGIKRKNTKPKKSHMPKSVRDTENKEDEE